MSVPTAPLVVTIAPEIGSEIEALARRLHRSSDEVVSEACRRHLATMRNAERDDEYARGYQEIPEETHDLEALIPHLPVPQENW